MNLIVFFLFIICNLHKMVLSYKGFIDNMVKENVEQNGTEQSIMQKQKMDAFTELYTGGNLNSVGITVYSPAENAGCIFLFSCNKNITFSINLT